MKVRVLKTPFGCTPQEAVTMLVGITGKPASCVDPEHPIVVNVERANIEDLKKVREQGWELEKV